MDRKLIKELSGICVLVGLLWIYFRIDYFYNPFAWIYLLVVSFLISVLTIWLADCGSYEE